MIIFRELVEDYLKEHGHTESLNTLIASNKDIPAVNFYKDSTIFQYPDSIPEFQDTIEISIGHSPLVAEVLNAFGVCFSTKIMEVEIEGKQLHCLELYAYEKDKSVERILFGADGSMRMFNVISDNKVTRLTEGDILYDEVYMGVFAISKANKLYRAGKLPQEIKLLKEPWR